MTRLFPDGAGFDLSLAGEPYSLHRARGGAAEAASLLRDAARKGSGLFRKVDAAALSERLD
jgi:hypothetical protein